MAKVYGIHEIEVYPGANEEEMVKVTQEIQNVYLEIGWKIILLKGDRGQREGKYAILYEIPSVEARDRSSPVAGENSEEILQWASKHRELFQELGVRWASFSPTNLLTHLEYTDYIELE